MALKLNTKYLASFVGEDELTGIAPAVNACAKVLHDKTGLGNDFLGWLTLPTDYDKEEFARIQAAAKKIQSNSDILIVIGIGGSYLGARAAIEFLQSTFYNNKKKDTPDIYYVGNNINPSYLQEVLAICEGKDISVNVISKSGTTTEPALAFRVFKKLVEEKYGKEGAKDRIFATTDKAKGTLKNLSDTEGYETFVVPDDVGGRYSVLTAVGLLPMAVAGIDIDAVLHGAEKAMTELDNDEFSHNPCYRYAALRNILLRRGKGIEIYASYEPRFTQMGEWLKQLYGESEGKDGKGLFPASVAFTTDLHSMGQFIQDGSRNLFETVIDFITPAADLTVEEDPENLDGLNFLSGMAMRQINRRAMQGTILAHTRGGVPNLVLEVPAINEEEYGYMVYFFMLACGVSGYLLGVNPFDQPGVEAYKKNMFALLGKPGYEDLRQELLEKLGE